MNKIKYIILIFNLCLFLIIGCNSKSEKEPSTTLRVTFKAEESDELNGNTIDIWKTLNYSERQGKYLFEKYCSVCHGVRGEGDGFNSYNLNPKPQNLQDGLYINKVSDIFLNQIISSGGNGVNRSSQMPYYKYILDEIEINSIISYIRKLNTTQE